MVVYEIIGKVLTGHGKASYNQNDETIHFTQCLYPVTGPITYYIPGRYLFSDKIQFKFCLIFYPYQDF